MSSSLSPYELLDSDKISAIKASMSYKSTIFFIIIFGIIIFGYFYYDTFITYFPINMCIKFFIVIIGVFGIFFPHIIKKLRDGDDMDNIKDFIIQKYKKK